MMAGQRLLRACVVLAAVMPLAQCETPEATEDVVVALDEETFKAFTTGHPKFLTLLHAPWDAQCKRAYNAFVSAARSAEKIFEERGTEPIVFSTVDCSTNRRLCKQFGAEGFPPPRLGIFNLTTPNLKEKMVFSDVREKVYTQHFYETIALTLRDDASDFTQNFERMHVGPHHIRHLNLKTVKNFRQQNPDESVMTLFYSHSCGHSTNFLPTYAAESNRAHELDLPVKFTSLNCARPGNNEYCSAAGVSRYPSIQYFNAVNNGNAEGNSHSGEFLAEVTPDTSLIEKLLDWGVSPRANHIGTSDEL